MGILDFLKAPPAQQHPTLGPLRYSGGRWRGSIDLEPDKRIPLFLPGGRGGPVPEALLLAERMPAQWHAARPTMEKELYEHYRAGSDGGAVNLPHLATATDVWGRVMLSSVEIKPYRSLEEFQVAIRAEWDDEHTLGALIRGETFVELNGSILEPR